MTTRHHTLRLALALAAVTVGLLIGPAPPAQAGTYEVLACDAAPGHLNHAWQFETNAHAKF